MTPQEANKIIAEYMGLRYVLEMNHVISYSGLKVSPYSKSLDALVPVWERYELFTEYKFDICHALKGERRWGFLINTFTRSFSFEGQGSTLQEAACIATAKAIEALK